MSHKMWKRLNRSRNANTIGHPTLLETTYDPTVLNSIPEVEAAQNQKRLAESPGLPPLPFKPVEPMQSPVHSPHYANPRVPSSIYSPEPSPGLGDNLRPGRDPRVPSSIYTADYTDCSPPVSPAVTSSDTWDEGSPHVSPVEDAPQREPAQPPPPPKSNLPIMRRGVEQGNPTKWDPYLGEPTTNPAGSEGNIRHGRELLQQLSDSRNNRQKLGSIKLGRPRSPNKGKLLDKKKPLDQDGYAKSAPRVPWKGASGRSPVVAPVTSNPAPKHRPLIVPQERGTDGIYNANFNYGSPSLQPARSETHPVSTGYDDDATRPIIPPKRGGDAPRSVPDDKISPKGLFMNDEGNFRRQMPPAPVIPIQVQTESQPENPAFLQEVRSIQLQEQPVSRFSTTTYATTNYDSENETPRVSTDVPVPAIPATITLPKRTTSMTPTSVFDPKATLRKPTPSQMSLSSMTSRTKSLPQCPPEMQAVDRIAGFEAKLEDLRRRRGNIQVIMRELTQVIQPSSITYDLATRDEVKKTVASLENELSDIGKEEHEVGLKLHRALKKRDQEDIYGANSTLWIKRVTS